VGCRYHLFLDVRPSGNISYMFGPDVERLRDMPATCALDVADNGAHDVDAVGKYINASGQLAALMCQRVVRKLHRAPFDQDAVAPEW